MTDATEGAGELRTFLIADVRGYTRFTQAHGDEAAARLAAKFAEVVREQVERRGGTVVELRGDEALCVFGAPRAALRAAVDLQRRCAEELRADPSLPLGIGIGIDAGEAVPVAGGYRGGALNLAARLCSAAKRGEVLVSDGIVHLARRTDELTYIDRGQMTFKGFDRPVHVMQVAFELDLPEEAAADRRRWWTPVRVAAAAVAAITALAVVVALAATHGRGQHHPASLGTNVVGILDDAGHITGQVPLNGRPTGVAAGAGAIWATIADRGEVVQIDPRTGARIDTVGVGPGTEPTGIAVGGGGVWVADSGRGSVTWINARDPAASEVPPIRVGQGPGPIAFGDAAAWVVNATDGTLQKIDGSSYRASKPVAVGGSPTAVAVGGGWVWVTDAGSSTVVKVDPATLQVVSRSHVGNNPVAAVYGGGKLWVANAADATITRLDPASDSQRQVPVAGSPTGIAYGDGAVWATASGPPSVVRIDAGLHATASGVGSTPPLAPVVASGRVWVAATAAPATHRGGTLKIGFSTPVFSRDLGRFDPAVAPYREHWQMLSMTNDGLVTYRRAGGAAGLQVVPDLAVSMPTVGDGGRTYTFQLRRGVRYSTGRPVRASDFRYAVERALAPPALRVASRGYYQSVIFSTMVGYAACHRAPAGCDMRRGIQTDDRTGTITIHLTRADPALPLKLATSFADLLPPGSPPPDSGRPVPATGPYMIARVLRHGAVWLVRNPHFRQWSADAQPAGFPDRIRWVFVRDPERELSLVERGTLDAMMEQPPADRFRELAARYALQRHTYAGLDTQYLSLNTRLAPFDRLAARRAVNLAVDRGRLARVMGGPGAFVPTCQVLPPGMFGYAPYCPYTAGSTRSGVWSGPDLAKARRLVRASGTEGARVVLWEWGGSAGRVMVPSLVRTLNSIGFRASAHVTPPDAAGFGEWNAAAQDSRRHVALVLGGWAADYPNPIDFLDLLLSCRAFVPGDPNNLNSAEFCDARLDALIQAAEAVQVRDPAAGAARWQAADREVVDQAAWAPLLNDVGTDVVSPRVGNYQHNPEWAALLDQLWVR